MKNKISLKPTIVVIAILVILFLLFRDNDRKDSKQERAEKLAAESIVSFVGDPNAYHPISFTDLYISSEKALKANKKGFYDKVTGCYLDHTFVLDDMGGYKNVKQTHRFFFDIDVTRITEHLVLNMQEESDSK